MGTIEVARIDKIQMTRRTHEIFEPKIVSISDQKCQRTNKFRVNDERRLNWCMRANLNHRYAKSKLRNERLEFQENRKTFLERSAKSPTRFARSCALFRNTMQFPKQTGSNWIGQKK